MALLARVLQSAKLTLALGQLWLLRLVDDQSAQISPRATSQNSSQAVAFLAYMPAQP